MESSSSKMYTLREENGEKRIIISDEIESSEVQEYEIVNFTGADTINEIDINNVIKIKDENGIEQSYLPVINNGQIIMTPLIHIDESVAARTIAPIETPHLEQASTNTKSSEAKYLELNNKIVRVVPIEEEKTSTKRRVAPHTYRHGLSSGSFRKLLIDPQTVINAKTFSRNMLTSSELCKNIDLAPRSRRQMQDMVDSYTKLFAYPSHKMADKLRECYTRHCTSKKQPDCQSLDDLQLLPVGYKLDFDRPYKRITRPRHKYIEPQIRRPFGRPIEVLIESEGKPRSPEPRTLVVDPLLVNETSQNTQIVVIDANGVEHEVVDAQQDKLEALLSAAVEQNMEVNIESGDGSDNEEYNLVVADQDQYIIVNEDQVIQTICSDTGQTESIQIQFID